MNTSIQNIVDADFFAPHTLRTEQKRGLRFGALTSTIVALGLTLMLMTTGEHGRPSPVQHDTLMLMQYARALAEGHPYEYQAGDPPTTGGTSHLYPALLSVFYRLGLKNESLHLASLLVNAVFYVAVVVFAGLLGAAVLPHLMWLAMTLVLLSGPVLMGAFGQTDMGLFMVCALGVWTALLYERPVSAFAALTAAVWTRPEGAIVALAVTLSGAVFARRSRRATGWLMLGLLGLAQFGLVLCWNRWLTGSLTFHSILGKGYWVWHSWQGAIKRTAREAAHVILGAIFCAPVLRYKFRLLYGWPILSGLLAAIGWIRMCRDEKAIRRAFAVGSFIMLSAAVLLSAASGWQGFFFDRHLAWIFPLVVLLVAAGVNAFYEDRLRSPRTTRAPLLTWLITGYAAITFPVFVGALRMAALTTGCQVRFARDAIPMLVPEGNRLGILNFPGLAYVLPHHKLVHLGGYISHRFASPGDFVAALETLKYEPDQRFSHWLLSGVERRHPALCLLLGPPVASETDVFPSDIRLALFRADWAVLDAAKAPPLVETAPTKQEWALVDRVDVGYDRDETAHDYAVRDRDPRRRMEPGLAVASANAAKIGDVGRVVLGEESFRLRAIPGRPARLVWRTAPSLIVNARYDEHILPFHEIKPGTNACCRISINGKTVAELRGEDRAENAFTETVIDISGDLLAEPDLFVKASGDHISFGWWLYQPRAP